MARILISFVCECGALRLSLMSSNILTLEEFEKLKNALCCHRCQMNPSSVDLTFLGAAVHGTYLDSGKGLMQEQDRRSELLAKQAGNVRSLSVKPPNSLLIDDPIT